MNSIVEIAENSESNNVDGNKRKRSSIAALNALLKDTDDENSSSEAEDSEEYSDDDWNTMGNKKKKRNLKKNNKSPVQTLKKKLAEKTKTLRKSIKQNRSPESDTPQKVEKEKEVIYPEPVKNEKTDIKEEKTEACKETKEMIEKLPSIKIDKIPKIEKSPTVTEKDVSEKISKKVEPVILTYATVKNSACMSPFLMVSTTSQNTATSSAISSSLASVTPQSIVSTVPTFQLSTSTAISTLTSDLTSTSPRLQNIHATFSTPFNTSPVPIVHSNPMLTVHPNSVQNQFLSLSGTSPVYSQTAFPAASPNQPNFVPPSSANQSSSTLSPCTNVARLRINPNLQTLSGVGQNLFNTSPSNCNVTTAITTSPRLRVRHVPVQKTPTQLSPSPKSRATFSSSAQNNSYRPRRLALNGSPNTNITSPNSGISPRSATTPRTVTSQRRNEPAVSRSTNPSNSTLHTSITSIRNISSRGTVIVNGSNSVTITPRKIVPERPPVQRTLFKNEIEGIIAARIENGVLRYVVNLANGTHLSLSNLQVTKLREQNDGILPTKLKIPVPSDVAAKIEPSFLIED